MPIRIGQQRKANPPLRPRALAVTAVVSSVAVLAAGCGASAPTGPGASPATFTAAAFRYASCMRRQGLTAFPDPSMTDHNGQPVAYLATPTSLVASPAFKSANKVCQRILAPTLDTTQNLGSQAARGEHMAAFAKCMRSHGVPTFPDPNSQGQLSQQMITSAGVDLEAPAVSAAAKKCLPSAGGAITAQQIERAITGAQ